MLAKMRPEVAVSVLAAAVNSLEAFVVFGIARRLRATQWTAVGAAAAAGRAAAVPGPPQPRLLPGHGRALRRRRSSSSILIARLRALDRPRVVLVLGGLIALALLTYTQSLLNFAVLLPLFLRRGARARSIGGDATSGSGARPGGGAGAVLSLAVFYGRYVPTFVDMQRGVPMPEERILLEKPSTPLPPEELAPQEPDDPYAGPTIDPWRGLRKAGWRLYVFYGLFAPVVVAGVVARLEVLRRRSPAAFVAAWALTYLALNLLSGGLPGPNLVRYNKDLEVVAPLFCLALARIGEWLWARSRGVAASMRRVR